MSISDVLNAVTFWNTDSPWTPAAGDNILIPTDSQKTLILNYISELYSGSTDAAALLDSLASKGHINISSTTIGSTGYVIPTSSSDGYLRIDFNQIAGLFSFDDAGSLIAMDPLEILAHELSHYGLSYEDPAGFTGSSQPSDALMNSADYDNMASAVVFERLVESELGHGSDARTSYEGIIDSSADTTRFAEFVTNKSYTHGQQIDIVRIGDRFALNGSDDIDVSARTDGMSLLAFGLGGDDQLVGGTSSDYLYGGDGSDTLDGRNGDDYLFGGAQNDTFIGSKGNDVIWGGDENLDLGAADGIDTVDYSAGTSPITINYDGTDAIPAITVDNGTGGTDTLHSIEVIKGTPGDDKFTFKGAIPQGYNLTIDADGGQASGIKDVVDFSGSTDLAGMDVVIDATSGFGYIKSRAGTGGQIELKNFHTDITGSPYSDVIDDESSDNHSIDAGAGDDTITVGGANATIDGGAGNDVIHLESAAATIKFGAGDGHDVVDFDNGDGDYNLALQNLNPDDIDIIAGGRWVYDEQLPGNPPADTPHGIWLQFIAVKVKSTGDTITFLENGQNIGPDGSGSAVAYNKDFTGFGGYDDPENATQGKLTSITFADGTVYDKSDILNGVSETDLWAYDNEAVDEPVFGAVSSHSASSYLNYVNQTYLQAAPIAAPPAAAPQTYTGTSGDDNIHPGYGDDTVTGGAGNDTITESPGDDTYVWNIGDGDDVITGSSSDDGFNTLKVGAGISASDLQFAVAQGGAGLTLTFAGQDGSVTLGDALVGDGLGVDQIQFSDGSVMSRAALLAAAQDVIVSAQTIVTGTSQADYLFPARGNFVLTGGGGDDQIFTTGDGSGIFNFASSDGHDEIYETGTRDDDLNLTDADPDGVQLSRQNDDLVVTLTSTGASVRIDGQFTGDDSGESHGLGSITFADGSVWSRSDIGGIIAGIPDDHPPVAQASAASAVEGGAIVRGSLTVTDPDQGDTLKFALDTPIDGLILSSDGNWSFDPSSSSYDHLNVGQQLTLSADYHVSDLAGATASSTLMITLTGTNDVPKVTLPLTNHRLGDGDAFSYDVSAAFSDPDDALTLSASLSDGSTLPGWLSFAGGLFTGTPPAGTSGVYNVVVSASDGAVAATASFLLHVGSDNQAPVVQSTLPDASGNIESPLNLAIPTGIFADPDGDALTFSATLADGSALPDWLSFSDGHLIGTPPDDAAGDYAVKIAASDGVASTSSTFDLSISSTLIINGTKGDDTIVLPQSNFIANPGRGHDSLQVSGDGAGTILFAKGDGYDTLDNPDGNYTRDDTLSLTNILPSDVTLTRSGNFLDVTVNATGDDFQINEQFATDAQNDEKGISYIKFADGTTWDRDAILDNAVVPPPPPPFPWGGFSAKPVASPSVTLDRPVSADSEDALEQAHSHSLSRPIRQGGPARVWEGFADSPHVSAGFVTPASISSAAHRLIEMSAAFGEPRGLSEMNLSIEDGVGGRHSWAFAKAASF